MNIEQLEAILIKKLDSGLLDGIVGSDFVTGDHAKVTFRKIIEDGVPKILRFGADHKYFDNKENVQVAGKVAVQAFKTVAEKLAFLQKYGWLIEGSDIKAYSKLFKP